MIESSTYWVFHTKIKLKIKKTGRRRLPNSTFANMLESNALFCRLHVVRCRLFATESDTSSQIAAASWGEKCTFSTRKALKYKDEPSFACDNCATTLQWDEIWKIGALGISYVCYLPLLFDCIYILFSSKGAWLGGLAIICYFLSTVCKAPRSHKNDLRLPHTF